MVHERERDEALSERLPREKTPARSFDRDGRRGELLLERLERSEVALDLVGERARRLAAAARLHVLPVLHVVLVARAVERDEPLVVLGEREVAALARLVELAERGVQPIDVRLVVLVVVELERRLVDVRLEGVVFVRQRGKLVGHGSETPWGW